VICCSCASNQGEPTQTKQELLKIVHATSLFSFQEISFFCLLASWLILCFFGGAGQFYGHVYLLLLAMQTPCRQVVCKKIIMKATTSKKAKSFPADYSYSYQIHLQEFIIHAAFVIFGHLNYQITRSSKIYI
jgi:hypothetical protein